MTTPSSYEQYSLELVNRARHDPLGEFDALVLDAANRVGATTAITAHLRQLNVDMALLRSQLAAADPVAPLAWNGALATAAEKHSTLLARNDTQSHQEPGEAALGDRIRAEGYVPWRWSENVFSYGKDPIFTHAGFVIDWGYGRGGMQDPAGHRMAILDGRVMEVGIGAVADAQIGPWVVTQDFASSGPDYRPQLVGVVIDDRDGDEFYDIGEGMGGVTVTASGAAGTFSTTTWDAGGYQMALDPGSYTVTFSGGGLDGSVVSQVVFGTSNVKLDAQAGDAAPAPAPAPDPAPAPAPAPAPEPAPAPAPAPDLGPRMPAGYMAGTAGADLLIGTTGRDVIHAGAGADRVSGGAGHDMLSGEAYDARFDPAAATVLRLYQAVLGRAPDAAGHLGWTAQVARGLDTVTLASHLVTSVEYQRVYGGPEALDDRAFITLLYENVLDRAPDPAGLAAWTSRLGAVGNRAEIVAGFAQSAEFVADTSAAALTFGRAGLQADWADDVFRLYQATLGRAPDAGGLLAWTAHLAGGASYAGTVEGFTRSTEFGTRYGTETGNADFVRLLYDNVLGRAPDAAGLAAWTARLEAGSSRGEVVQGFAQSAEFVRDKAPALKAWMQANGLGDDRLDGGEGNNVLFGGLGADAFIFARASGGSHVVADLEAWDTVVLRGFGYATVAEARTHLSVLDGDTVFADQGVRIVFEDSSPSQVANILLES